VEFLFLNPNDQLIVVRAFQKAAERLDFQPQLPVMVYHQELMQHAVLFDGNQR